MCNWLDFEENVNNWLNLLRGFLVVEGWLIQGDSTQLIWESKILDEGSESFFISSSHVESHFWNIRFVYLFLYKANFVFLPSKYLPVLTYFSPFSSVSCCWLWIGKCLMGYFIHDYYASCTWYLSNSCDTIKKKVTCPWKFPSIY